MKVDVSEYIDEQGKSPFGRWFDRLDVQAAVDIKDAQNHWSHFKKRKREGR